MDPKDLAALKRKHAATEDPAKKAEMRNHLLSLGHDPDEKDDERRDSKVPEGRTADKKVTTEDKKPVAKAAVADEDKPDNRPVRKVADEKPAASKPAATKAPAAKAAPKDK